MVKTACKGTSTSVQREDTLTLLGFEFEYRLVLFEEFGPADIWTKTNPGRSNGVDPDDVEHYIRMADKTAAPPPVIGKLPADEYFGFADGQTTATAHFHTGVKGINCYVITSRVTRDRLDVLRATFNVRTSNNLTRTQALNQVCRLAHEGRDDNGLRWSAAYIAKHTGYKVREVEEAMRDRSFAHGLESITGRPEDSDKIINNKAVRKTLQKCLTLHDLESNPIEVNEILNVYRDRRITNGIISESLDDAIKQAGPKSSNREKFLTRVKAAVERHPRVAVRPPSKRTGMGYPKGDARTLVDQLAGIRTSLDRMKESGESLEKSVWSNVWTNLQYIHRNITVIKPK